MFCNNNIFLFLWIVKICYLQNRKMFWMKNRNGFNNILCVFNEICMILVFQCFEIMIFIQLVIKRRDLKEDNYIKKKKRKIN